MTVHWNSRNGFGDGSNATSSTDDQAERQNQKATLTELLWAMRKVPEARASVVARGRRLLSDPGYPSREVLRRVARVLAKHLETPAQE
jgi:hypothetical protein